MIVVDASALLEALLRPPAAIAVAERLFDEGLPLHAPHLIDVEVAQVLRRCAATGQVEPVRCRGAIDALQDFSLWRYPHEVLLGRVWELRHNLTAYDAVQVALAEMLDARLSTRDHRIAAAAGHHATVELVQRRHIPDDLAEPPGSADEIERRVLGALALKQYKLANPTAAHPSAAPRSAHSPAGRSPCCLARYICGRRIEAGLWSLGGPA